MRSSVWTVVSVSVLAAAAAPGAVAQPPPTEFRSRFYSVTTDMDEPLARHIAEHMDVVHRAYSRRFEQFTGRGERPLRQPLHLYAEEERYLRFLEAHGLDGAGSAGMFFVRPSGSALCSHFGDGDLDRLFQTLQHEGFHQFAWSRIGPRLPIWVNEGLAEYFGEAVMVGGELRTGGVSPDRLARLRKAIEDGRHLPFDEMLGLTADRWSERVRRGEGAVLYDQAWSVAHFLVHADPRYRSALDAYLMLIAQGRTAEQAFGRAFGTSDHRDFERAWRRYVAELAPSPVKTAAQRLMFLAHGMRYMRRRGRRVESLAHLRGELRAAGYRMTQHLGHGATIELRADDERNFTAPHPAGRRGAAGIELVASQDETLPPGAVVRGLELTVRLVWGRGPGGEPISRIVYE